MNSFIFAKLSSKKFRKWKMDEECVNRVRKAIDIHLKKNDALEIIFPQGGYKLWRLPSAPEADWAEFFNIAYVIKYLAPIASAYKPGVKLTYYLHTLLMELHDNLTTEEINKYIDSFTHLVSEFNKFLPKNFKILILKDADIYPRKEYFEALEKGTKQAKKMYENFTAEQKNHYYKLGALNIKWNGKENWEILSKQEKEKKIYLGSLYELAATGSLPKVMDTIKSEDKILLFTKATGMFIGIGSTKNSIVKYWTGFGVLEQEGDNYYDRILSPSQLELVKKEKYEVIKIKNFIPLKNFTEINVYQKRFNFTKK